MVKSTLNKTWIPTILLASISLMAGVTLLLLSGWFLSACAVAGLSAATLSFNYVIPSAAIRFLTFFRIATNYGEKVVGHNTLLTVMNRLRVSVFDNVILSSTKNTKAEEMERVVTNTHHVANWFLAVLTPAVSVIILMAGLLVFTTTFIPEQTLLLVWILFFGVLLFFMYYKKVKHTCDDSLEKQQLFRDELNQELNSASIWTLSSKKIWSENSYQRWIQANEKLRALEYKGELWLLIFSCVGILLALYFLPQSIIGKPLLVCLPLLLLAFPDWFGQALRAVFPAAQATISQRNLNGYKGKHSYSAQKDYNINASASTINSLVFRDFSWQREQYSGCLISTSIQKGDITWLQGSSGSGKSSLLMSIAGLLPHTGSIANQHDRLTQAELFALTPAHIVYSQQFPHVLSDTLRQNLLLAKHDATEQELVDALKFAELTPLLDKGLDQWLGERGRLLSGGEQKRLGIARAYLSGAEVWLLDEPLAAQDDDTINLLSNKLKDISKQRIIVIASHRLPDLLAADNTIVL